MSCTVLATQCWRHCVGGKVASTRCWPGAFVSLGPSLRPKALAVLAPLSALPPLPGSMSWLLDDALLIGVPLLSVVLVALVIPACMALRGNWRSWTVAPPAIPRLKHRPTTYFSFSLLCSALVLLTVMPSLVFEALNMEEARVLMWTVPFWTAMAPLMLSIAWWPACLGPKWCRQWRAAGGNRKVLPWRREDIAAAMALPDGRRKDKILRNIEVSKSFVELALGQAARHGGAHLSSGLRS